MSTRVRVAMPGDPRPRARGWLVAAVPLAVFAALALIDLPLDARFPSGYAKFHMHGREWRYPLDEVLFVVSMISGQTLLAVAWLASRGSKTALGARAFVMSVAMTVVLVVIGPWAMHADDAFSGFLAWQFMAAAWLFVVALGHGVIALATRRR
jgi:hypothetical protein